jgi:hypothetical protein
MAAQVLFRQRFVLPKDLKVVQADLWVEADSILEEAYLNGRRLPWRGAVLGGRTVSASVERLVRPGDNLIAFAVSAPGTGEIDAAGMAWRLTVLLVPPRPDADGKVQDDPYPPFTVRTVNGGRIPAERVRLDGSEIQIDRQTGDRMELDRASVRWIEHWPSDESNSSNSGAADYLSPAIPGAYDESRESEGVWTVAGTFLRGQPKAWAPDATRWSVVAGSTPEWKGDAEPGSSRETAIRAMLVSPAVGEWRWDLPVADLARLARVLLRDGTRLTGLLDRSGGAEVKLLLPPGSRADFSADEALRVDFPAISALQARTTLAALNLQPGRGEIGFIGEAPCQGGLDCPESVVPDLRRIAQALGVGAHWLKPEEWLMPDFFSPERFPVVINLDQQEAYYHTIQNPGDGHQALLQYMNRGGILIHLAPGTPFYYGRQAHARQWSLVPLGGGLNRAFGLGIGVPGSNGPGILFEAPENSPVELEFLKVAKGPWSEGLPERVLFPQLTDSRFRPVSPECQRPGGTLIPLYRLTRGTTDYGLGAAVVKFRSGADASRPGYAVYLSWPLAMARDAFGDSLLPRLLPSILSAIAHDRTQSAR